MSGDLDNDRSRENLDRLLADYMRRIDRGERVDEEALIAAHPELAKELRKYFSQAVALDCFAGVATANIAREATYRNALRIRCPHCHAPTELRADAHLADITCAACGSHFSLVDQREATRAAPLLTKLGRFELIERLGVGGFGSVWKARDRELDRTVAIKIPHQGALNVEEQEKFFREARTAAQLRHPNIVSVHEVGRDGEAVYIVSDFVRGITLGDWLTGQHPTSRESAELCAKIADALDHAHEQGVVHRDLKPANIMIDHDGQPHLMDFGLARREVGEVTVTIHGQVLGTPAYMSPEQALGEAHTADGRSDVYSLGVILFRLLTGELPFRGNTPMMIHQVIHDEPPSPRSLNTNAPKDLETITLKCLEKDASRRYQTAQDVAAELRRWLAGESIHARPVNRVAQAWRWVKRNPRLAALTISVALLLVAVAVISTLGNIEARNAAAREAKLSQQARQTVDDYFTFVSQTKLLDTSGAQPLRKDLLDLALNYYRDFAAQRPHDPQAMGDLAAAYFRMGTIDGLMGADGEARQFMRQATLIWERLVEQGLGTPEIKAHLAAAYVNLATLGGEPDEAIASIDLLNRAREIWEASLQMKPEDIDYRVSLARTLDQIAELQQRNGQQSQALQTYASAGAEYQIAIDHAPRDVSVQVQFAVHLKDAALAHAQLGDLQLARQHLDKAVEILEQCVRSIPDGLSSQRYLAIVYYDLGSLMAASGELETARTILEKASAIQAKISEGNPSVPAVHLEYAETLAAIGQVESVEPGRMEAAQAHYRDAIRITTSRLGRTDPRVAVILSRLALIQAAAANISDYRATCKRLMEDHGSSDDPSLCNVVAWACSLRPESAVDRSLVVTLAAKAIAAGPKDRSYLYTYGTALFRAGRYDEALDAFQQSIRVSDSDSDVPDKLFVLMTNVALGRIDDARSKLSSVEKEMDSVPPARSATIHPTLDSGKIAEAIECRLILSEARQVIDAIGDD